MGSQKTTVPLACMGSYLTVMTVYMTQAASVMSNFDTKNIAA